MCIIVTAVSHLNSHRVVNEDDWNESSIKEVKEKGASAPGIVKYFASKTAGGEKGKPSLKS